jgi:hypothetical protein
LFVIADGNNAEPVPFVGSQSLKSMNAMGTAFSSPNGAYTGAVSFLTGNGVFLLAQVFSYLAKYQQ